MKLGITADAWAAASVPTIDTMGVRLIVSGLMFEPLDPGVDGDCFLIRLMLAS